MGHDDVKWLIGALFTLAATVLAATFRLGSFFGAIDSAKKELTEAVVEMRAMRDKLSELGLMKQAIEQLEKVVGKNTSDIRDLLAFKHRLEGRRSRSDDDE